MRRTSKDIIGGIREMDTAIQNLKIGFVKVYEDVYTRHFYSAPNKKKAKSAEPASAAAIDKKATDSTPSSSHNSSKGNNDYEDMEVVRGVLEIVTSAATNTEKELAESEAQPLPASAKEEDGEQLENPEDGEQLQPTYREQMNQAFRESFFGIQKGDQQQESGGAEEGSPTTAEKGEKDEAAAMSDTPTETLDVTIELPETSAANGTGGDGEEGDEDERTIPDYDDDERLDEEGEEAEDYNWDEVLDEAGRPATFLMLQKLKYECTQSYYSYPVTVQ